MLISKRTDIHSVPIIGAGLVDANEEVYEPYLIMEGYLNRTPQGRVATELSYKKLGLKPNSNRGQGSFFA